MPEMSEERLKLLVYKYLADSLTEDDSDELNTFGGEHPQIWLLIARLQDEDQLTADLGELYGMNIGEALDEAWSMTGEEKTKPFYKRAGWRTAAIILPALALLGGGVIWIRQQRSLTRSQNEIAQHSTHAIPPNIHGGSKAAMLTLNGGKQLNLLDQPKGDIALQKGARIVKTDSAVSYLSIPLPFTESRLDTSSTQYNSLSTPRRGLASLILSDGTRVWLNDSSSLSYPTRFSGPYREVTLTGEAFFEVAKDGRHPFRVKANELTINVLGTSFNIRAYTEEGNTTATLLNGRIALQNGRRTEKLAPNQQIRVDSRNNWQIKKDIDTDSILAWKNHLFYFTHADIPTVMHELSKWYNIDVDIQVSATQYYYNGEFSKEVSLSDILNYLTNEDVHFLWENNKVIVTP